MSAKIYGTGLVGLLKRGWTEIPAVMGSSVMALIGLGLSFYIFATRSDKIPKYKMDYIVYRPDDPKAKAILMEKQKE